ncbi:hypothetical protein ACLOAU_18345 [Niabella sp. CJ426]|uniref:hypothetical protein n=1 Tax=Niabella sp. CJ426 TaxID=3393740 RepID=UPI003CFF7584
MIVPSMAVQEIHNEVFEDIPNLRNKLTEYREDFRKTVLKASRYPLTKSYACKTKAMKNSFSIDFTAQKRSHWKSPILSIFGMYDRPEGKYAFSVSLDFNLITIYPPHFFQRFRERIAKNMTVSNENLIKDYFKNDWGFIAAVVNKDFESVYHNFEENNTDEKISFVAATSKGYCFGEKQGSVNIIKTIVSEEMLFGYQKHIFSELKHAFREANKDRYGFAV